ncbi:tRNA epoxyqueuosine(34) reductase QueG [Jannaschia seosinensis]|uniref:tRNA epoxyqueuosine(34) reductase QueG n=1 Tax=Jannaschia seosinensis TaxID=313367 RepID=UPI0009FB75FC|nr:tRNA epoxyqueuosine(34) reductase QueG [Jannaschia seosinensis]
MRARLDAEAREAGFVSVGVCRPDAIPDAGVRLRQYLADGNHGGMSWMGERVAWRGDPSALWPEARSVVMLAHSYAPEHNPMTDLSRPDRGTVSAYAQGRDYHEIVKKALKRVARWMVAEADCEVKVFVDTAPVMEKPLAQAAGIGWQGKHTNLLSREFGNWVFLGAIFTTLELAPDAAEGEHCGSCTRCLDICPTDAFPAPFQLNARRCISYLTIEHHGPVDESLRPHLGNRIYGCDDCLAVCPWNKFAVAASDLRYRGPHRAPDLADLAGLDDAGFRARFSGSPIKRIGRNRMTRNVCYAIGNSGEKRLGPVAQRLCDDADPVVADAARWAVDRLS